MINLLRQQAPALAARNLIFRVDTLACRDPTKPRDFLIDAGTRVTSDAVSLAADPNIDMVVEVSGGGSARELVLGAAKAGKHVVTANKALLAAALPEVEAAFRKKRGPRLGFEAAVAGGIPIIRTLATSLRCDTFTSVSGILNGTTNFMLSAMDSQGTPYGEVLADAQAAGFAETDPTADVEGHDACNKLVLLARLAFGVAVPPSAVRTVGISGLVPADFAFARSIGCTIKLVGAGTCTGGGRARSVQLLVSPTLVPRGGALGSTGGALNLVATNSELLGPAHMVGAGAGRLPTAGSVVADMVAIGLGEQAVAPFGRPLDPVVGYSTEVDGRWYVRVPAGGSASEVAAAFDAGGVSAVAVHPLPGGGWAVLTPPSAASAVDAVAAVLCRGGGGRALPDHGE